MKPEPDRSISVEDLLRLKRAERPPSDFWSEFDHRLREKQLSALVAPKPWWRSAGLVEFWHGFRRVHVPLGATAILAVTLVTWQIDQSRNLSKSVAGPSPEPAMDVEADNRAVSGLAVEPDRPPSGALAVAPSEAMTTGSAGAVVAGSNVIVVEASVAPLARDIPLLGVPSMESREDAMSWPARIESAVGVQNEFAEAQQWRSLLGSVARFEARLPAARSPVEPLKQITPPAERRGARILTAMVTVGSVENAMRTTERAANRLSEERLYDQIQRFGARGAGVSVKF